MSRLVKNIGLYIGAFLIGFAKMSCSPITDEDPVETDSIASSDGTKSVSHAADSAPLIVDDKLSAAPYTPGATIETKNVNPHDLVRFAHTLIGTPYKYASTDPKAGFDCSGFITYVFNHFDIAVPRSSRDFTDVGKKVSKSEAKPGDLILFTGTDSTIKTVGHMGIVTFNSPDTLLFIHSTSGKMNSVTVTPLNNYYQTRFVKIIRIFQENYRPSAAR